MSQIFISHSSHDNAAAAEVQGWLVDQGHTSVFLDFDRETGIPAGRDWERELYRKLRGCRAVIVLCSRASMDSNWVFAEITQARALGKDVFPVKIDNCTIDRVISDRQEIDLTIDPTGGYDALWRGLVAAGLDPADQFEWNSKRDPYPGLLAFGEADAAVFFGRDDEVTAGMDLLKRVRRRGPGGFVMVLGASGSGKSSLVRAGFVPRLKRDPERWLVLDPVRPTDDLVRDLAEALSHAFAKVDARRDWSAISDCLRTGTDTAGSPDRNPLIDIARELRIESRYSQASVLVVLDQFEEVFGRESDHPSTHMLGMLRDAAEQSGSPLLVVGTMRSDFLGEFQTHRALLDLKYETLMVGPLSPDGVAQVIERPAELAAIELEPGLTNLLVSDSQKKGTLPLLAFTLEKLWKKHGKGGRFDIAHYREFGGLEGAVAKAADDALKSADLSEAQMDQLRRALLAMVRPSDDGKWIRRIAHWDDLPKDIHGVLEHLVTDRLLVSDSETDHRTLEVAHEALFHSWDQLAEWLRNGEEALRLSSDIHHAATRWDESGRHADHLWRGARLARSLEFTTTGDLILNATATAFVDTSYKVEQAEEARRQAEEARQQAEAERRRRRRLQITTAVALLTSILATVSVVFFLRARSETDRANEQAAIALARQARAVAMNEPALGVALAAEAYHQSSSPETRLAVLEAKNALRGSGLTAILDIGGTVADVAFSPDGGRVVTAGSDGTAKLWDLASGAQLMSFEHDESLASEEQVGALTNAGGVSAVAFSPDGSRVVTAGSDGTAGQTAKVWDVTSGEELVSLTHAITLRFGSVEAVAFSPDGGRVVTAGSDGTAKLWDLASEEYLMSSSFEYDRFFDVFALDPDARRVVTAGSDGTAKLWDLASGEQLMSFEHDGSLASEEQLGAFTNTGAVSAVAFSPDGSRVVTAGSGTAKFWDVTSGEQVGALTNTGAVSAVAFSPDGDRVVTAGSGTAKLWEVNPSEELVSLTHATGLSSTSVELVAFSPDGGRVVTAGSDGTAKVWDVASGEELVSLTHATGLSSTSVEAVAFRPDGDRVVTAGSDGTAKVWDVASGEELVTLSHESTLPGRHMLRGVAFSPDGTRVVTAGSDGTAKLWDLASRERLVTFQHPGMRVMVSALPVPTFVEVLDVAAVAFSPDGGRVATAGSDGTAKVWDVASGEELVTFSHESTLRGVAFSPDGNRVVTAGSDGTTKVWDVASSGQLGAVANTGVVSAVAFSPEGDRVVTAESDGTTKLWDVASGKQSGEQLGALTNTGAVSTVAFSPDGDRVVTAGSDGTAKVWDVALSNACRHVALVLKAAELRNALGGAEPAACTDLAS